MSEIKDLFAPYKIALLAKEKGFNENCLARYIKDCGEIIFALSAQSTTNTYYNNQNSIVGCAAPIYQQLIDWLRKKDVAIVEDLPTGNFKIMKYGQNGWEDKTTEDHSFYWALTYAFKLI